MEDDRKPCLRGKLNGFEGITIKKEIARGGSSLVYLAEQNENGTVTSCIIKEYCPIEKNITVQGVRYVRDESTGDLKIIAERDIDREKEKECQNSNIEHELRANQLLIYDGKIDENNCPYVYKTVRLNRAGCDTTYLKISTGAGKTLKTLVDENNVSVSDAVDYTLKMLEILDYVSSKKHFVHGDIAPENLWISGEGKQRQMKLLDFGSAFQPREYKVDNLYNEKEVLDAANIIMKNIAIGSSHKETRSSRILDMACAKEAYRRGPGKENAVRLIKTVQAINVATDIYSCLKILFLMVTGRVYVNGMSENEISQLIPSYIRDAEPFARCLHQIMKNNEKMAYRTVKKAQSAVKELYSILKKEGISGAVLYAGSMDSDLNRQEEDIDESLLGDVKEWNSNV